MHAQVGDQLVVAGHRVGEAERRGEIVEIKGAGGEPPFVVQWEDGHTGLCFPSSDAQVEHPKTTSRGGSGRRTPARR